LRNQTKPKKFNRTTTRAKKKFLTKGKKRIGKAKKNELRVLFLYLHIHLHMSVNSGSDYAI